METLASWKRDISFADLPQNYKDAITITRYLGIRYLWIDSLCIIQDGMDEWHAELRRLAAYYENATLNIVAGAKIRQRALIPRTRPRFLPICVNELEEMYVGWLATDSYCDPKGLNVERFPDGWKCRSSPHRRAWIMQEIRLARRNLEFQVDEPLPPNLGASSVQLSSQLYLQCQQEIRWGNGRSRSRTGDERGDWYELVEEYSGRHLTREADRLSAISALASNHWSTLRGECGEYMAGLWAGDAFRGLLWQVQDLRVGRSRGQPLIDDNVIDDDDAPTWSWASCHGKIKHIWPLNASVCAEVLGYGCRRYIDGRWGSVSGGYIKMQGSLVEIVFVDGVFAHRVDDIEVDIRAGDGHANTKRLRIRYFLDRFDSDVHRIPRLYAFKITRRVALLVYGSPDTGGETKRIGLMIVAKPDTQDWASVSRQCEVKIV